MLCLVGWFRNDLHVEVGLSNANELRGMLMRYPVGLFVAFLFIGGCSASKPAAEPVSAEVVAKKAIGCLHQGDSDCLSTYVWDREALKTGLSADALAKVIKGPFREQMGRLEPKSAVMIQRLDSEQVEASQAFVKEDGRTLNLIAIATGKVGEARLTPLSMELFVMMGNAEQNKGESHFVAWRLMLRQHRGAFESYGWKGVLADSTGSKFQTWDKLDVFLKSKERSSKAMAYKGR